MNSEINLWEAPVTQILQNSKGLYMSSSLWWMFDIPHTLYIKVKVNKGFIQISLSSSLCQRPQDQWITAWDYFITASVGSLGSLLWMIKMGLSKGLWEDYGTSRRPEEQSLKLSIKEPCLRPHHRTGPGRKLLPASLLRCYCLFVQSTPFHPQPGAKESHSPARKTHPSGRLSQLPLSERDTQVKCFVLGSQYLWGFFSGSTVG